MKLDSSAFDILFHLDGEVNPHELYNSNGFKFSRATFYRRLENLKQLGLIEWRVGKAKLTEKGLIVKSVLNSSYDRDSIFKKIQNLENRSKKEDENLNHSFRLYKASELKDQVDNGFIYVDYPQTSFILRILMELAGIEEKAKTNVEKFKLLKSHDFKVKLAINHFENSPKQLLVFLEELIKLGRIKALYIGVKDERKALKNKKLLEFLQEFDFENERFKLPKKSVTLFPLFLLFIIGTILFVAFRVGYQHASIYSVFLILYFLRSSLFRELRSM